MNVTTWICFWMAVIGIAEVIQAHKPPAVIVQPVLKDEMLKDDEERENDE